ncbi:MAG: polyprenyl synthetase family protein [Chloroflexi bacterium]|nr:polyprenyl synthetase family protein [Chloroflexota bacterium]
MPADGSSLDTRLIELGSEVDSWTRLLLEAEISHDAERFGGMLAYHLGWRDEALARLERPGGTGKKLRCGIALLTCEALTGLIAPAGGAAVALELVHNFSLVHDDIQDESDIRRHRPTVWKLWGVAQGINVGDALFALAQVALVRLSAEDVAARLLLELNRTCVRLVEGQYLDLAMQHEARVPSLAEYEGMIARKTAALFACAARLGAIAGGATLEQEEALAEFGYQLGLGFQEQDDVLGVWATEAETGKPVAADVGARKKGLPAVLALHGSAAPEWLRTLYLGPAALAPADVPRIVNAFEQAGVQAEAERRVEAHFALAREALSRVGLRGPSAELLQMLTRGLTGRKA